MWLVIFITDKRRCGGSEKSKRWNGKDSRQVKLEETGMMGKHQVEMGLKDEAEKKRSDWWVEQESKKERELQWETTKRCLRMKASEIGKRWRSGGQTPRGGRSIINGLQCCNTEKSQWPGTFYTHAPLLSSSPTSLSNSLLSSSFLSCSSRHEGL